MKKLSRFSWILNRRKFSSNTGLYSSTKLFMNNVWEHPLMNNVWEHPLMNNIKECGELLGGNLHWIFPTGVATFVVPDLVQKYNDINELHKQLMKANEDILNNASKYQDNRLKINCIDIDKEENTKKVISELLNLKEKFYVTKKNIEDKKFHLNKFKKLYKIPLTSLHFDFTNYFTTYRLNESLEYAETNAKECTSYMNFIDILILSLLKEHNISLKKTLIAIDDITNGNNKEKIGFLKKLKDNKNKKELEKLKSNKKIRAYLELISFSYLALAEDLKKETLVYNIFKCEEENIGKKDIYSIILDYIYLYPCLIEDLEKLEKAEVVEYFKNEDLESKENKKTLAEGLYNHFGISIFHNIAYAIIKYAEIEEKPSSNLLKNGEYFLEYLINQESHNLTPSYMPYYSLCYTKKLLDKEKEEVYIKNKRKIRMLSASERRLEITLQKLQDVNPKSIRRGGRAVSPNSAYL